MSVITFDIQNALYWLTHRPPVAWGSPSHLYSSGFLQQGSSDLLFNSAVVLSIARCSLLLQAAKMWVNLMT